MQDIIKLKDNGVSSREVALLVFGRKSCKSSVNDIYNAYKKDLITDIGIADKTSKPKVAILDIETCPILGSVWSLWQQNVGLNQIKNDWFILSYSAKWLGSPSEEVIYEDLRGIVSEEDDTTLLRSLWTLLDDADIIITQNGKKFDAKKINARLILNGFQPPSSYKHIDTLEIAKRNFAFTSNKLEYMTDKLCTKYKKLKHAKYAGFELWKQCLLDNEEAWDEMKLYNEYDVLSLEELYFKLAPWDKKHPNMNLYTDEDVNTCRCGSTEQIKYGFYYTQVSKFQRYKCKACGAESRDRVNLFSKEKSKGLRMNLV